MAGTSIRILPHCSIYTGIYEMTSAGVHEVGRSGHSVVAAFVRLRSGDLYVNVPPFAGAVLYPDAGAQEKQTSGRHEMKGLPLWWTLLNLASRNCRG